MSERAEMLARRLEEANAQVIAFAEICPNSAWIVPCVDDGRTVAAVVRHVGGAYGAHARLIEALAAGEPVPPPFTDWASIHEGNAASAQKCAYADRNETVASLRRNGATLAVTIRALSDEELDRMSVVAIFRTEAVSTAWIIENVTTPHPLGHLTDLRATVGAMP